MCDGLVAMVRVATGDCPAHVIDHSPNSVPKSDRIGSGKELEVALQRPVATSKALVPLDRHRIPQELPNSGKEIRNLGEELSVRVAVVSETWAWPTSRSYERGGIRRHFRRK